MLDISTMNTEKKEKKNVDFLRVGHDKPRLAYENPPYRPAISFSIKNQEPHPVPKLDVNPLLTFLGRVRNKYKGVIATVATR